MRTFLLLCLVGLIAQAPPVSVASAAAPGKKLPRAEAKNKPHPKKGKAKAQDPSVDAPLPASGATPPSLAPAPADAPTAPAPAPAPAAPAPAPAAAPALAPAPSTTAAASQARSASPAPAPNPAARSDSTSNEQESIERTIKSAAAAVERVREEAPAAPIVTLDHSPRGAMKELAVAIAKRFAQKHGDMAFHRVAIPYFRNSGPNAEREKVGQLAAELLSVELQQQQKFVIVERERIDQLMREHRLKDLGVVDEGSAAEFGKVLGAQSLILGTVNEAGANYIVTARQVDAEKGTVLVSAEVAFERQGLLAISSDAIETRSRLGAGFRSAIVPGWGQIYNKEPVKGALLLSAALGVLGGASTMIGLSTVERNRYSLNRPETVTSRSRANTDILAANALLISYGALWAIGLVDALVNGKDHTTFTLETEATAALSP